MQRGLPDLLERQAVAGMATAPVLLPTPTARAYGSNQSASAGAAARPSRATSAARLLLPTPTVADSRPAANATAGRRTPTTGGVGDHADRHGPAAAHPARHRRGERLPGAAWLQG